MGPTEATIRSSVVELVRPGLRGNHHFGDSEVSVLDVPAGGSPLLRICRAASPSLEMVLPLDGAVIVRSESREEHVVRGDEALFLVGPRRYAVHASRQSLALAVSVPAAAVEDYAGAAGSCGLVRSSAVLTPTKRFLTGVMENHDELERLSAYFIEKLIWEMVASLLLESRGAGSLATPSLGLLDRAMAQIAAYRTDQSLTPVSLAQSLSISMRHLQRVFSAIGSTPSREIRRQRAELALSMLKNPAFRVLSVSQVAHHSGFADAADLRRAFDALGYPTPTEVRSQAE
ncbi:MAG: helix-turn-helix domain-containing protein [Herbiconiux sp.]|nr:helix-turn-helix domain-containing protein [Herbiconiux sp.]